MFLHTTDDLITLNHSREGKKLKTQAKKVGDHTDHLQTHPLEEHLHALTQTHTQARPPRESQHHYRDIVTTSPFTTQLQQYDAIANGTGTLQRRAAEENGLPTQLQSGIESLSGIAMDDVRVHYNSSKPAQLQAHAYAQGTDIHLAPGQERHLPHEAWHVVQQKQGRVKPTLQLKGVAINDDTALEREADRMGEKALSNTTTNSQSLTQVSQQSSPAQCMPVVQRIVLSKVFKLKQGGLKTFYYSTYDKKRLFERYEDALSLDAKLEPDRDEFDAFRRYATNFSYYNARATSFPESGKQGPHSLTHSSLAYRLDQAMQDVDEEQIDKVKAIIQHQIPTPKQFEALLQLELPTGKGADILLRMLTDYQLMYRQLADLMNGKRAWNRELAHELIMRLMQMHPYTAYGKGKSTARMHIKGKNERKDDDFDDAFDSGASASFRKEEEYEKFKQARKKLWGQKEKDEEMDEHDDAQSSQDLSSSSKDTSMSSQPKKKQKRKASSSADAGNIVGERGVSGAIVQSVADFIRDNVYDLQGNLLVVDGKNWTCYIRCILHHFGQIGQYRNVMARVNRAHINVDDGVVVGSDQEDTIRVIIADVIGQQYHVSVTDAAHGHGAVSSDTNGTQVSLLLTGAHFSLLR